MTGNIPSGAVGGEPGEGWAATSNESEVALRKLRQRWELASVLNFLQVFEPVIGSKMKFSAEEIETALITPNSLLAQLHIMLLKGIPPVSKTLNASDAWVTVLCKKLAVWWPWVAEEDIPITAAKGEEISRYKKLDPTTRLLLLRALCEIRAGQGDAVSYINDALKNGSEVSSFRKEQIAGDGNGPTYWYDGNALIGHRLYKEVRKFESNPISSKGTIPAIISEWETLATNLQEFRLVVDQFSSCGSKLEEAVIKTIETDAIPVLHKLYKKKERELKQQRRQEMILNGFRNSGIARFSRSCRPVSYTFDEYDKAIDEAIQLTKKSKTAKKQRVEKQQCEIRKASKHDCNGCLGPESGSGNSFIDTNESIESDSERKLHGRHVDSDGHSEKDDAYNGDDRADVDMVNNGTGNKNQTTKLQKQTKSLTRKPFGSPRSNRLAGTTNYSVSETKVIGAKNRSRQRPIRNSALESTVVPDSQDDQSCDDASNRISTN